MFQLVEFPYGTGRWRFPVRNIPTIPYDGFVRAHLYYSEISKHQILKPSILLLQRACALNVEERDRIILLEFTGVSNREYGYQRYQPLNSGERGHHSSFLSTLSAIVELYGDEATMEDIYPLTISTLLGHSIEWT